MMSTKKRPGRTTDPVSVSGHSEFNLSGLDPEQYPLLPQVSRDDAIQLSVKVNLTSLPGNFLMMSTKKRPGRTTDPVSVISTISSP
jgi:hypothetical protein